MLASLSNLSHETADCPRCPGHDHGLPGLWLTELQQAEVGGVARHPAAAQQERLAQWAELWGGHDPAQRVPWGVTAHLVGVDHAPLNPASQDYDGLTNRELWVPAEIIL